MESMRWMCIEILFEMSRFPTNAHSLHTLMPVFLLIQSILSEAPAVSTHQPRLWTLLNFSLSFFLSAEFCVLLVEAPIFHLAQTRRSHQFAKIRWPLVFLLSPRTPMLIVETTRQVACEPKYLHNLIESNNTLTTERSTNVFVSCAI